MDRLEAPKLLGNQIDIIKEHILDTQRVGQQFAGKDKNKAKEEIAEQLRKAAEERGRKAAEQDKTVDGQKVKTARDAKDQLLHRQLTTVLSQKTNNRDEARAAFLNFMRFRIAETTRQYNVLASIYEAQSEDILLDLSRLMRQRYAQRMQMRAGAAMQAMQQESDTQGSVGRQQQARQPRSNPIMNFFGNLGKKEAKGLAKKGFKDLLKNQLKKKAEQTIIRVLFLAPPYIGWWIVGILLLIILIIVVIVVIVVIIMNLQNQPDNATPIPGLTLALSTDPPGKTNYDNGQNVNFVIDAVYTGTYSLVLFDQTPDNATIVPNSPSGKNNQSTNGVSWSLDANTPLPDSTSAVKHWKFTLTFSPKGTDFVFHNTVSAEYAPGSGPNALVSPSPGSKPQAGGSCSPDSLQKYFGSEDAAATASCICKYESGADPGATNLACLHAGGEKSYNIGLFQINLLTHGDVVSKNCAKSIVYDSKTNACTISNSSVLTGCKNALTDPVTNINAAVTLYHQSRNNWEAVWPLEKGKCF